MLARQLAQVTFALMIAVCTTPISGNTGSPGKAPRRVRFSSTALVPHSQRRSTKNGWRSIGSAVRTFS
jgi:hypothetical protein